MSKNKQKDISEKLLQLQMITGQHEEDSHAKYKRKMKRIEMTLDMIPVMEKFGSNTKKMVAQQLVYAKQECKTPQFDVDYSLSIYRSLEPEGNITIITSASIDNCDPTILMLKYTKTRYYA